MSLLRHALAKQVDVKAQANARQAGYPQGIRSELTVEPEEIEDYR